MAKNANLQCFFRIKIKKCGLWIKNKQILNARNIAVLINCKTEHYLASPSQVQLIPYY